jgi:8-oxo-dGTP diphosphatase
VIRALRITSFLFPHVVLRAFEETRNSSGTAPAAITARTGPRMSPGRQPHPTVDIIIELAEGGIVLIRRRNPPHGWAIPGGFIDYGESASDAARREAAEETGLCVTLRELLNVYSDPNRDPRGHTLSVVYIAQAEGAPKAADDAAAAGVFNETDLPAPLAFDHAKILSDYFTYRRTGCRPPP